MNAVIQTQSKPPVPAPELLPAWEPFTPRGVAAFSRSTFRRLLIVQSMIAAVAALTVAWCLHHAWFPEVEAAIRKLPPNSEIRAGKLEWTGPRIAMINEGRLLSFAVDLEQKHSLHPASSIQWEFGTTRARAESLLGVAYLPYQKEYTLPFNRDDLEPWWGAWRMPILAMAAVGAFAGLLFSWWALALIYCLPLWLMAFLANRGLTFGGSLRLAGAALMPGAVLFASSLFIHASGGLDLLRLLLAAILHIVMGWIFAGFAIRSLPPCRDASLSPGGNPFSNPSAQTAVKTGKTGRRPKNPWAKPEA